MCNDNQGMKDINDVFNDIVFTEEQIIQAGYKEGFVKGASEGNTEGYHLGYHRGCELGAELGYYLGITEQYLSLHQCNNLSEKIVQNLLLLQRSINDFPKDNSEIDIFKRADDIRSIYKKTCALLKIDASHPETHKLSF